MSEHVAVWIDHMEARICRVFLGMGAEAVLAAPHHVHHNQARGRVDVKEHPEDTQRFFGQVSESLAGSAKVLLLGPSTAKLELLKYLQAHHSLLALKIVGVETVDYPTNGQLVAHANAYFGPVASTASTL